MTNEGHELLPSIRARLSRRLLYQTASDGCMERASFIPKLRKRSK